MGVAASVPGVALALAAAGYSVAIGYRSDASAAAATATACRERARDDRQRFHPVHGDVAVAADRERLLAATLEEFGGVEVLVNNAGIAPRQRADLLEASEESFAEVLATNLTGPYFLTQAIARHWLAQPAETARRRAVIFVNSISAAYASVSRGEYCVSKAGLAMARELFAVRLAEAGIGVYEVRPGLMETDMTRAVKEKYDTLIAEGLVPQGPLGNARGRGPRGDGAGQRRLRLLSGYGGGRGTAASACCACSGRGHPGPAAIRIASCASAGR